MSVKRYQPAPFTERVLHASDDGEYVKYDDYAALEAKCSALAAENEALASLEAERAVNTEPVAWIRYCSDGTIDGPLMNYQIEDCRKLTWTPLYAVKPTKASIHDVLTDMDALEGCREWLLSQERTVNVGPVDGAHDVLIESTAGYLVRVVDACRAAMLQGAEPVSNRDELPDGWVACSERMPEVMVDVITSNGVDIGKSWWDGDDWKEWNKHDAVPGKITHWQPLPSPPAK